MKCSSIPLGNGSRPSEGRPAAKAAWIRKAIALAVVIALWCGAVWIAGGRLAAERIEHLVIREREIARTTAETIGSNISQRMLEVRSIPFVLSWDPSIIAMLARFGPDVKPSPLPLEEQRNAWLADSALHGLSHRLNGIRSGLELHTLFVLNAAGDCIAAGKLPELPSFIGVNYSDRQYYLSARQGMNGRQFAVGRTDNINALFYSSPVFSSDRFVGVIVSRININSITNILYDNDTFATDTNGVVVLAQDTSLLMMALPDAAVLKFSDEERENIYKQQTFETLDLEQARIDGMDGLVRWRQGAWPSVHVARPALDGLITVHALRELKEMEDIRRDRVLGCFLVSLTGSLALLLVAGAVHYVRSTSVHRAELTRLNASLAIQASTDALTGCANRRSFINALEAEHLRCQRYNMPFSILTMDIDMFKCVNDVHGHPCGDQVLCHLVHVVNSLLRQTDLLGRIGGEEFCVLLPQTLCREALLIAERICSSIASTPLTYEGKSIPVTVSIGVAQWDQGGREPVQDFLRRCDLALYAAKDGGRNRVEQAGEPRG